MKHLRTVAAVSVMALGSAAFAHGDEGHDKKAASAAHRPHASALGQAGDAKNASRTVEITMSDAMRFDPSRVAVKRNETIRFVLKNDGQLKHEMVLGTIDELKAHAALMAKFPQMEHADANQASVAPGQTAELVWQFTKSGSVDFACLEPGHYEAGMRGRVVVGGQARRACAERCVGADRLGRRDRQHRDD